MSAIEPGKKVENYLYYKTDMALPYSRGGYHQLKFADVETVSDLRAGLDAAREKSVRVKQCMAQAGAKEAHARKMTEEKIIRETPAADVQRRLAAWRATLNTGFAQTLVLGMGCN